MFKRSLAIAALAAFAVPAAAQDAPSPMFSTDRPDGVAPAGIVGDRLVEAGALEFHYRFQTMGFEGIQLSTVPLFIDEVLDFYATTPFERSDRTYGVQLTYGLSDRLSLLGTIAWLDKSRSLVNEEFFIETESSGVSDVAVEALFGVWDRNAVKVHLHGGVEIPVGAIDQRDDLLDANDQVLPYEMQLGTGSISIVPGITAQIQNGAGTVGAQVKGRIRVNDNDRDYRLGDEVEGGVWLDYRINRFFSINSGARFRSWGTIQGLDAEQDPTRDPGEDGVFSGGERVDMPLGLSIWMPEGTLAGHRLQVEYVFPVHQDYDAFRLTADKGVTIAWRKMF